MKFYANYYILILLAIILSRCKEKQEQLNSENNAYRWIDDIVHDPDLDDSEFTLCHGEDSVLQYFNDGKGLKYAGEKLAIEEAFFQNYDANKMAKESGLVRIRFVVNCKGKTGRFRVMAMDDDYNPIRMDHTITEQLLAITKVLNGWQPMQMGQGKADYYQYLIFKIDKGHLTKILP